MLYFSFYLLSFILGAASAWLIINKAHKFELIDHPNHRSSHQKPTPTGSGIGILAVFVFVSLFIRIPFTFWIPATFLALLSFFQDKLKFSLKFRLFFQFSTTIMLLVGTINFHNPLINWLILIMPLIVFVVGTTNFYNFMDGINGIAAITGIVGFGLLAIYAFLTEGDMSFTVISVCISFSCLGFLPFNVPKAKVFMGDVGSILLGFVFAGMVIVFSKDFLDFVCLASFLFPFYADELSTMAIRIKDGENIFRAHRRHLYQLLVNEKGIAHWKVSVGYGILQLLVGLSVIALKPFGLLAILILLAIFFSGFIWATYHVRRSIAAG